MVTLIDYGAGNVTSVAIAVRRLGAEVQLTSNPQEVSAASSLIFPGVGHCAALLGFLDTHSLRRPLLDAIARGTPFLGICLGLQALYQRSEEAPEIPGLGLLPGQVHLLPRDVKLPHMGWNQIRPARSCPLLDGISPESYFYFAHSYAAPADGVETAAICKHGHEFTAVLECNRTFGVQFHPEKSGAPGATLLANFLRLAA
jgi:imidazole glycerol phosphate synthase glutamine amidotransferase subunit